MNLIDSAWLARFRRSLRRWHDRHGRDLPWRNAGDPYRVWISEIMLQQTTVAAVVPYFERFIERFPTIDDLAAAGQDEVLRQWEGLGYYSRARNIHKTARQLVDEAGGRFPPGVDQLKELPGIGRYTAGAIASFAFDRAAPIVEANTQRLYCRLLGYDGDPRTAAGQRLLWEFAESILPRKSPGRFNQALMDLGATLCTPAEPNCPRCPVKACCRAFADGTQSTIPRQAARPAITDVTEAAVAVRRNGRYLLRRIPDGRRWAGLWDFVRFPLNGRQAESRPQSENGSGRQDARTLERQGASRRFSRRKSTGFRPAASALPLSVNREVSAQLAAATGLEAEIGPLLAELRHSVTRYRIRLLCFTAKHQSGEATRCAPHRWMRPRQFGELPLSVTGRKLADLLAGL